ncbi:MAG TPA: hypothetical protein VFV34_16370 [Blastocatellia bacterium]|nr:hypothetical protein [Blastocatellia bacterium]
MAFAQFEKDFGYLMPFIKRVTEAARAFPDLAAREELSQLVSGEEARWARIADLLAGGSPASKSSTTASATLPQTADTPSFAFTVGSLRKAGP